MFYYLFDNLVWMANMGAIMQQLIQDTLAWRDVRNAFSLIKTVCESLTGVIKLHQSRCKVIEIEKKLFANLYNYVYFNNGSRSGRKHLYNNNSNSEGV